MGILEGKAIVVTGASRGLGETMALGYAAEGADLVLAARSTSDLERVAAACREAGAPTANVVTTDITQEDQVRSLVSDATGLHGRIDVFVANAGGSYLNWTEKKYAELPTYDVEVVEQILRLNTIGTWLCMKHALPVMKDGSSFITIGSMTGRAAHPGSGFYAISKSTIDVMTRMAAGEMKDAGVRVNCFSPGGMVDTHLFGPNKMNEHMRNLPHVLPADVMVPGSVWLASDDSRGVTGALITGREFNDTTPEELKARLTDEQATAGAGRR